MSLKYSDSFAMVTPEEALEIAGHYYRIMESLWGSDDVDALGILHSIKEALDQVDFVIAHRYEWESGMS